MSTPGLLVHAVKTHGWGFIPNQVLPPLVANTAVGSVLYVSYLQILGALYEPSAQNTKRVYPPPSFGNTFTAGFAAGGIQSLVAAPLDALQVRFQVSDMVDGKYKSIVHFGRAKLQEIGLRGVFSGWGLSFTKDCIGYAVFFSTFEYVKANAYLGFVSKYYGRLNPHTSKTELLKGSRPIIKPHFALEPTFLLLAGVCASVAQQFVCHPLALIQNIHYKRLAELDIQAKASHSKREMVKNYYHAYEKTFAQCRELAVEAGGMRRWLYKGFIMSTLRQVPSTSAGLIIFELVRRRYGLQAEPTRIEKDGYDILLT
jgi:Mitochondrial carrier protein